MSSDWSTPMTLPSDWSTPMVALGLIVRYLGLLFGVYSFACRRQDTGCHLHAKEKFVMDVRTMNHASGKRKRVQHAQDSTREFIRVRNDVLSVKRNVKSGWKLHSFVSSPSSCYSSNGS